MPTASTSTSASICSWSGCRPARAGLVIINGYITVLSVQFIQSSWIKRMPITKLPSSVVSTALVIGFGLMTIYSLVFFVKDLKRSSSLDGEVDA